MVVVVMVYMGRCRMGAAERRTGLGVAGLFLVAASGFAAYGICSAFGEIDIYIDRYIKVERSMDGSLRALLR